MGDHNKDRCEKSNTASKEGTANAAIADVAAPVPEEDDAACLKYNSYQSLMSAMEELEIGMIHVGHSDNGVVEYMNAGITFCLAEHIIPVSTCLGIRAHKALVKGSHLTCTSSTWTVVQSITTFY